MSQKNVDVVRRLYAIFAGGVGERTVLTAVEEGLAHREAVLDLSTAYPDGPVVRFETMREFFDTQPCAARLGRAGAVPSGRECSC